LREVTRGEAADGRRVRIGYKRIEIEGQFYI